jgi:hypothetical protein
MNNEEFMAAFPNPLEGTVALARRAAEEHIQEQRIGVEALRFVNIAKIHHNPDSITFITAKGKYVVIEIDENYGDGSTLIYPPMDINYAHRNNILPDGLFNTLKDAEQALRDGLHKDRAKRDLAAIVMELGGVTKVKLMLDEGLEDA